MLVGVGAGFDRGIDRRHMGAEGLGLGAVLHQRAQRLQAAMPHQGAQEFLPGDAPADDRLPDRAIAVGVVVQGGDAAHGLRRCRWHRCM